jgi:threonine dehydrogenase-like Zn-dependent dehydrogenase
VRRGGTISLSGVYGGMADPMPMLTMFDKQIQLRMGPGQRQALGGRHPAAAHRRGPARRRHVPHARGAARAAPQMYETFQKKQDGCVKVLLKPGT